MTDRVVATTPAPGPGPRKTDRKRQGRRRDRRLVGGLLALLVVPVAAGVARIGQLSVGVEVTPENARFFDSPAPVVIHIIAASTYGVLGAFQFVPRLRRRPRNGRLGWHRAAGRLLVPAGLVTALTGLWMNQFYDLPDADGEALYLMRLAVGTVMAGAIVIAVDAVRRRDITRHRAWMLRAYALAMGAGTQVLTHLPWVVAGTTPGESGRAVAMGAGWAINAVVAEWAIRQKS